MKRFICILITVPILLFSASCLRKGNSVVDNTNTGLKSDGDIYYTTNGYQAKVGVDYLVVQDSSGLRVINLANKTEKKIMSIKTVLGFDIYDGKVVWSDLRNEKNSLESIHNMDLANADIFLYDIKTDKIKQITSNTASQTNPKMWDNYIVWQDNRNDSTEDNYAEWDIYLYDLNTGKEKQITTADGVHTNPAIHNSRIVWEDGRNCKPDPGLRGGGNVPENNTDIYLYDIKSGQEMHIANGKLQECSPSIFGDYVVWEDRNNGTLNADIALYDLNKKERKWITRDKHSQWDPHIYGQSIVWMDERRGNYASDVYVNGKAPNSDIFLYDLVSGKEKLMTGDLPQILPDISEKWLTYVTSKQVDPEVFVVKLVSQ